MHQLNEQKTYGHSRYQEFERVVVITTPPNGETEIMMSLAMHRTSSDEVVMPRPVFYALYDQNSPDADPEEIAQKISKFIKSGEYTV